MGNELSVSELLPYRNGAFPWDLTKYEKRKTSYLVPVWDIEKCIECGLCSYVCPSKRNLLHNIRLGKQAIIAIKKSQASK